MDERLETGGCACGGVRFTARGEPKRVAICHCLTCRKIHGAPFAVFVIYPVAAVTVEGTPREWGATPSYQRAFCGTCGSRVFGREGDECELMAGCFDAVGAFLPQYEAFAMHREPWLPSFGLPLHERSRTG